MTTQDDAQQWNRVAQELEAYRAEQQLAWGNLDNLVLGRYLAGESTPEEIAEIQESLRNHPELGLLLECVSDVLVTNPLPAEETAEPETVPFRPEKVKSNPFRSWVFQAATWATAACLLFAFGFVTGKFTGTREALPFSPNPKKLRENADPTSKSIAQAKLAEEIQTRQRIETELKKVRTEKKELFAQLKLEQSQPQAVPMRLGGPRIEIASANDDLPKDIVLAQVNEHLARFYVEAEQFTMAEAKQQEVVKLWDKVKGPEHPKTEDARACLQSIQAMNAVCGHHRSPRCARSETMPRIQPVGTIKVAGSRPGSNVAWDVNKLHAPEKKWFTRYQPPDQIQRHYAPYLSPNFKRFQGRKWESARQRFRKLQDTVSSGDVYSGYALNRLLRGFRHTKNLKPEMDVPPIRAKTLQQMTVTKAFGNVGLIRSGVDLQWPSALQTALDEDQRQQIAFRLQQLATSKSKGADTTSECQSLLQTLAGIEKQFAGHIEKISAGDYLRAVRYLVNLKSAVRGVHFGDLAHNKKYQQFAQGGKQVHEVIHYLTSNGLRIAPAVPGDEGSYTAIYTAFTNYKVLLDLHTEK